MADRPPPHVERDTHVTRETTGSGSKTGLALIVGGLVVAVAIIAFIMFGGDDTDDVNVTTGGTESAVEGAADDAGAAVEGAAEETGAAVEGAADAVEDTADPAETQPVD